MSPTTVLLHRDDGTTTAAISGAPRAYRDENGAWQPLSPSVEVRGDRVVADRNLIRAELPRALADGGARFSTRDTGEGFAWTPLWPRAAMDSAAVLSGNVVRYPLSGELAGVTEEFVVQPGAVKHNVVIATREALRRATTARGDHRALAARLTPDPAVALRPGSAGALELHGRGGKLFSLPPPYAYELEGPKRATPARYVWDARAQVLSVEVPSAWLDAPDRTFPIAIDPPATTLTSYMTHIESDFTTGPGWSRSGPEQVRLGGANYGSNVPQDNAYYAVGMRFDLSAIAPSASITAASINVFFPSSPGAGSMPIHFSKATNDPETAPETVLWTDLNHEADDYATIASVTNTCNCWINGGNPATQTGTALAGTAVSDLNAALPSGEFVVAMHTVNYVTTANAYPATTLQPNAPELYVTFTGGPPAVTGVSPNAGDSTVARTTTVLGTSFQSGATAVLRPTAGGADTAVTVTYRTVSKLEVTVPLGQPAGTYYVLVTTPAGTSPAVPASIYTVLSAGKTWTGATSTDWATATNWSPNGVPDASTPVTLPVTVNAAVLPAAGSGTAYSIRLTGGTLRSNGATLTLGGDLTIDSGTLDMAAGGTVNIAGSAFFAPGSVIPGTGTVRFNGQTGRTSFGAVGKVFFEDFEPGSGWTVSSLGGSPTAWTSNTTYSHSPFRSYYQAGKQLTNGGSALDSPSFSLAGKTSATLRWRTRYRISPEGGSGTTTSDGWAILVSTDGGGSWTPIAPHTGSAGSFMTKVSGGGNPKCKTDTAKNRVENVVPAAPAGLFSGEEPEWIEDSVSLNAYVGQANVKVRFASGWDNCNDYLPWEGVYIDDVLVEANTGTLTLNNLALADKARLTLLAPLQLNGTLNLATSANELDLSAKGITVAGTTTNAGAIFRGGGGTFTLTGAVTNAGTIDTGTGDVNLGALTNTGAFRGGTGATVVNGAVSAGGVFYPAEGAVTISGGLSVPAGAVTTIRGGQLNVTGNLAVDGTFDSGPATIHWTGGAASFTGAGTLRQSGVREVLFYDGFETATLGQLPPGWTSTKTDPQVRATPPGVGAQVFNLAAGDAQKTNHVSIPVNTTGKSGIWVTFGRSTTTQNDAYAWEVQYSLDGGTTWKTAKRETGILGWAMDAVFLSGLDPAVDNNPNLRIGFQSYRDFIGSFHYLDEVRVEAGTPGLGNLVVAANAGTTKSFNPASSVRLGGTLAVNSGTAQLAAGKRIDLANMSAAISTVAAGAKLDVEAGAALALSGFTTLDVSGTLELVGVAGTPAKLTSTDTTTPGRWAANVAGTFNGNHYEVWYPNAAGLNLQAASTVTSLDNGAFHAPAANGALLTLSSTARPASVTGASFDNDLGVAAPVNVDGSANGTATEFVSSGGSLVPGEDHDRDFNGLTPGNITWRYPATQVVVVSATEAAPGTANSVTLTIQARDAFGQPSADHPAYTATVAVTGSASVVGSPISIPSGASSTTVTINDTTVETVNVTLTETSATTLAEVNGTATFIVGSPSKLLFAQQPTNATAGATLSPAVTVRVTDAWDNTITTSAASVAMAIASGPAGATLGGTTPRAAASGVATFADLSLQKSGTYTLTASSTGLTAATSASFVISPAAPHHLTYSVQPSNAVAGVAVSPAIAVQLRDQFENVTTSTANVTLAIASGPAGGTLSGTSTRAAVSGTATFNDISFPKAGSYTLAASSAGVTGATSSSFVISPAAPHHLTYSVQPSNAVAGVAISPAIAVQLRDQFENLTASTANVVLAIATGPAGATVSGTTTQAAVAGTATFANISFPKAGSYTLTASSAGVTSATSSSFVISPAAPHHLTYSVQPSNAVAGVVVSPVIAVEVRDQFENLTSSTANVVLAIASGPAGATMSGTTTRAAVAGTASFNDLSFPRAGTYTLSSASTGLTGATSASFVVSPAAAHHLTYSVQPSNAVAGVAISPAIAVQIRDQFENVTTSTANVVLAIATGPAGATLSGTTPRAAISGTASFNDLSFPKAGSYTLAASSTGVTGAISTSFVVSPAAPHHLTYSVQPSNTVAGVAIAPAISVQIRDQFENLTASTANVVLGIASGPAGATLAGTLTQAAIAGTATFADVSSQRAGTYTLSAGSAGLLGATSSSFVISPSAPHHLTYSVQPSNALAGAVISPAIAVQIRDQFENLTSSTANVVLSIATGPAGATLAGTASQAAAGGTATFGDISFPKAGTYTLAATSTGVTSATSSAFVISPAAPHHLTYSVQPSNAVAGAVLSPAIAVQIRDQFENLTASTANVTLSIATGPAGATLSGTATRAAVGGTATFGDISFAKSGTYTLTASSASVTSATSGSFVISPAAPHHLTYSVQPSNAVAGAVLTPAIAVQLRDQFENVVSSTAEVVLAIATGPAGATLSGTTPRAAVSGTATFNDISFPKAGTYTLQASSTGVTGATSASFVISAAAPHHLTYSVPPSNAVAGVTLTPAITVQVRDQFENVTPSTANVLLAIATGPAGATLSGTATRAAVAGTASFNDISFAKAGTYALTASSAGVTSATSASFVISSAGAHHLSFTVQPPAATAGAVLTPAPAVQIRDQFENLVASTATVTLSIASGPAGGTLSGTAAVGATAGTATFADLSLQKAGSYTLSAATAGLVGATSVAFTISPAAAHHLTYATQPSNVTAGAVMAPAVRVEVRDQYENLTPSTASVTLAIATGPAGATIQGTNPRSAVGGVATFDDLVFTRSGVGYSLGASATGVTGATSGTFTVSAASATALVFATQPSNTSAGAALNPAVVVELRDTFGNRTSSTATVTLALQVNPTGATLTGTLSVAAVAGQATFSDLRLDRSGSGFVLRASSGVLPAADSSPFDVGPAAPAQLSFSVQPVSTTAGQTLANVRVQILDGFGNPTTSTATVTLAVGTGPSGAVLGGTASVAAVSGTATFGDLVLQTAGTYTLAAASGTLAGATSSSFTISPATAHHLTFTTQPVDSVAGSTLTPALAVQIRDQYENLTGSTAVVALAIASGPAGASLGGTTSRAAVGGVASFADLALQRAGTYTLSASSGALPAATSASFVIAPAAQHHLTFTVQPSNTSAGAVVTPAVAVQVRDQFENLTTSTANVTLAVATGPAGATLGGTATRAAVAGTATFGDLSFVKTGTYTLAASSGALAAATSASFVISAAAASRVAFVTHPANTTAGQAIASFQVELLDSLGNRTTDSSPVTVAIASNPSGGSLSGTATVNAASGLATFAGLSIDKAGAGYTLTASSGALTSATSNAFDVLPGAASVVVFTTQPANTVAGQAMAEVVVELRDGLGNRSTSTANVTLAIQTGPAGATLAGTTTRAASGGVATFPGLSIGRAATGYTLSATAVGIATPATSASFDILPGADFALAFVVEPASTTAGAPLTPAVQVEVRDSLGNRTGSSVGISLAFGNNPTGAPLGGTVSSFASAGLATFSDVHVDRAGTGYTLVASSGALQAATSAAFNIAAGAPARVAFASQPTTTVAGQPIAAFAVEVLDSLGNRAPVTADVTIAIGNDPGGGALGGTTTVAAASGLATFGGLSINRTGTGYTLLASSGALAGATSAGFDITAGPDAALAFVVEPVDVVAGATLSPSVVVELRDALGNRTTSTVDVALALASNPGSGTLSGGAAIAAVLGRATFGGLSIERAATGYSLRATAGALQAVSASFDVLPGAPAKLVLLPGAPTSLAAGACSAAATVELRDALDNPAPVTADTDVALGASTGSVTFSRVAGCGAAASTASMAAGTAQATFHYAETRAGTTNLTATVSGAAPATWALDVSAGPASALVFLTPPRSVFAGACSPALEVASVDAFGNATTPAAAVGLTASSNPTGMAFFGDAACTAPVALGVGPGSGTASLYFRSMRVGQPLVTVSGPGLGSVAQQQDVVSDPAGPPFIDREVLLTAAAGVPYPYSAVGRVVASGKQPMDFGTCGGPADFRVDAFSGAVSWTPAATGVVSVCVFAHNDVATDTFAFDVNVVDATGAGPVADFGVTPGGGRAPLDAAFDGSASTADPSTTLVGHRWDFGDSSPWAYGMQSTWQYRLPGGYSPELQVTDGFGRTGVTRRSVAVQDASGRQPPLARISASGPVTGADLLTVTLAANVTPGDAPAAAYHWHLGDVELTGQTVTHAFSPGRYRVHLTVVDDNGLTGTDWIEVAVNRGAQRPPSCRASLNPPAVLANGTVEHGAYSRDDDGTVVSVVTTFEDGATSDLATTPRTYLEGRHDATLRVVDNDGLECVDRVELIAMPAAGALPPRILSLGSGAASCGVAYHYADGDRPVAAGTGPFTWSLVPVNGGSVPTGMTIDAASGVIAWVPRSSEAGTLQVIVRVTSAHGSDEQPLQVELACAATPEELGVGCACGTTGQAGGWLALLLWGLWWMGRRRATVTPRGSTP